MKNHGNRSEGWQRFTRFFPRVVFGEWGLRVALATLSVLWLTLMAASWADAAQSSSSSSDEYSFNWLDPDKKISVLQNRRYTKASKPMLSVLGGFGMSNPYRTTYNLEPRLAFYFSESFGIEAFYTKISNKSSTTFEQLQDASPYTWPVVREFRSQQGLLLHWVPWYAKINVFNKILYLDWYFSAGIGSMKTTRETKLIRNGPSSFVDENFTGYFFGTGHNYYLNDSFSVRLDFMGAAYKAPLGGNLPGTALYSNYNFNVGFGWRL